MCLPVGLLNAETLIPVAERDPAVIFALILRQWAALNRQSVPGSERIRIVRTCDHPVIGADAIRIRRDVSSERRGSMTIPQWEVVVAFTATKNTPIDGSVFEHRGNSPRNGSAGGNVDSSSRAVLLDNKVHVSDIRRQVSYIERNLAAIPNSVADADAGVADLVCQSDCGHEQHHRRNGENGQRSYFLHDQYSLLSSCSVRCFPTSWVN